MIALETERLTLEPLIEAHAVKLFPQMRDPRLYEFLDSEPPRTVEILETQYRRWEARRSPDGTQTWLNWAARWRGGAYVGWLQVTIQENGRADIAYLVFLAHQRQGVALEACRAVISHVCGDYGARSIRATIDPKNLASIALAKKLDLTQTGGNTHVVWLERSIPN